MLGPEGGLHEKGRSQSGTCAGVSKHTPVFVMRLSVTGYGIGSTFSRTCAILPWGRIQLLSLFSILD